MPKTEISPAARRARLLDRIAAARMASPPVTIDNDEFRRDVEVARAEYRQALRKGLLPAVHEMESDSKD